MNIIQKIRKFFTFTDPSIEQQFNEIIRRTNNILQLPFSYGNFAVDADGTVHISGGLHTPIRRMTTSGNITIADFSIEMDGSINNVIATLPTTIGNRGKIVHITAINIAHTLTLSSFGSQLLPDGTTSFLFLAVGESLLIKVNSDETGWVII